MIQAPIGSVHYICTYIAVYDNQKYQLRASPHIFTLVNWYFSTKNIAHASVFGSESRATKEEKSRVNIREYTI